MSLPANQSNFSPPETNALDLVRRIAPPNAIIHIGAGSGHGDMHVWHEWQIAHALIVDSDAPRLDWATQSAANHPGWQVRSAVLSDASAKVDYYRATNSKEDGLIRPEALSQFWPNLRTFAHTRCQGERLDALLDDPSLAELRAASGTWAVIECLPPLPILNGAGEELGKWSVIWSRVVLKPLPGIDSGATLDAVDAFLSQHGFICIHVAEANHPGIGHALFMRDWASVLVQSDSLQKNTLARIEILETERLTLIAQQVELTAEAAALARALDDQTQLAIERLKGIGNVEQERESQTRQLIERQTEIDLLVQNHAAELEEKLALAAQQDALVAEVAALTHAFNEQAQRSNEQLATISNLVQERDCHARLLVERQAQLDSLNHDHTAVLEEKSVLEAQRNALGAEVAALAGALNEQTQLAAERLTSIGTVAQERDSHAQQSAEQQVRFDALTRDHTAVIHEKSILAAQRDALGAEFAALSGRYSTLQNELDAATRAGQEHHQLAETHLALYNAILVERDSAEQRLATQTTEMAELRAAQARNLDEMAVTHATIATLESARHVDSEQHSAVRTALEAETASNVARQAEINALRPALEAAQLELAELGTKFGALASAHDAIVANNAGLVIEMSAMRQEIAAKQNAMDDLMRERSAIESERTSLVNEKDRYAHLANENRVALDKTTHRLVECEARLAQLEETLAERDSRQTAIQLEMLRAEAQLELIKDVLLREPSL